MKRLDEIKARAEAATGGPWETVRVYDNVYEVQLPDAPKPTESHFATSDLQNRFLHNDAEFVAHARTDVPVLVAAVEAVLELHSKWQIHDCECDYHTAESECDSEFMYTVCRECCTSNGYHTEECASEHIHGPTHPICPTVTAIHQALGEGEK